VSATNLETLTQNGRNKPYKLIYREGDEIKVGELKGSRELVQLEVRKKMAG
jgi:hypothetical protein